MFFLQQSNVMVERRVLQKGLEHPFLVGLHFSFQTTSTLYFVLDYVNGGEVCIFYYLMVFATVGFLLTVIYLICVFVLSFFTTFRERGHFPNTGVPSTLQRWLWHWATSTPSTLFTGKCTQMTTALQGRLQQTHSGSLLPHFPRSTGLIHLAEKSR